MSRDRLAKNPREQALVDPKVGWAIKKISSFIGMVINHCKDPYLSNETKPMVV